MDATLGYVFDALNLTRATIAGQVPLIGFCGSPWTLMAYMIEGGGSRTLSKAKTWLFRYPEASRRLLSAITDVCIKFLTHQVTLGGAQLLQVRAQTAHPGSEADVSSLVPVVAVFLQRCQRSGCVGSFRPQGAVWTDLCFASLPSPHPKNLVAVRVRGGMAMCPASSSQVFDSWGGELTKAQFEEFSLPYLARIATEVKANVAATAAQVEGLPARVPMTVFARLAHFAIEALGGTEYDVLSLDW